MGIFSRQIKLFCKFGLESSEESLKKRTGMNKGELVDKVSESASLTYSPG